MLRPYMKFAICHLKSLHPCPLLNWSTQKDLSMIAEHFYEVLRKVLRTFPKTSMNFFEKFIEHFRDALWAVRARLPGGQEIFPNEIMNFTI